MSEPDVPPDKTATVSTTEVAAQCAEPLSGPAAPLVVDRQADDSAPLWLRRTDQIVVGTLLVALLVLLTIHWLRLSRWGSASIEVTSHEPREYFYSLDINAASWVEWAQLDGIGEKLAKRIVANRDELGPFRNADDIRRVRGIHLKQLDSMKPFLRGGTASEAIDP